MMNYQPTEIEARWQAYWAEHKTFAADNHSDKPKYYVLDMFPLSLRGRVTRRAPIGLYRFRYLRAL
jgi:valyl-tRNA synthetase